MVKQCETTFILLSMNQSEPISIWGLFKKYIYILQLKLGIDFWKINFNKPLNLNLETIAHTIKITSFVSSILITTFPINFTQFCTTENSAWQDFFFKYYSTFSIHTVLSNMYILQYNILNLKLTHPIPFNCHRRSLIPPTHTLAFVSVSSSLLKQQTI